MSEPGSPPGEGPQHVTISTMPSVPPITGVVKLGPVPKRRNPWLVAVAVLLTVGAVGAGVFAVLSLRGQAGGAASPEGAVERLVQALQEEDVLGALDVMLPGERDVLREPLVELVAELQRLGLLAETADLEAVAGVAVEVSDLDLSVAEVTDDIANVEVRGRLSARVDLRALPLGAIARGWLDDLDPEEAVIDLGSDELGGLVLTTVRRDGRWYVSVLFSIAEVARREAGMEPVTADAAVRPYGSPSPEAAVDQMLVAVETLDLERAIAILDPREAAALQRYAPLFIDDAQAELDALDLRWAIEDVQYTVERQGDRATVQLASISVVGELDGEPLSVRLVEGCWRAEYDGERVEWCEGSPTVTGTPFEVDPDAQTLLDDITAAFADAEPPGLVLSRVDGSWYVSPVASLTRNLLAVVRALDRDELERLVDDISRSVEEAFDVEMPVLAPSFYDCLQDVSDPDAVLACIAEGIEAGSFTANEVPVELRFPQCRLVEPYLYGFWDLSDEEFSEVVEYAFGCFAILAFTGEVDPFEVPYEARAPECFGGVNPFGVDDLRETDRLLGEVNACLAER